jgi:transcription antitermination factor NusG
MSNAAKVTSSTPSTGPARPEWYALQTRPRHEKRAVAHVRAQLLEPFLPVRRCRHLWRNGVHADLELPLFPGYLFVRATTHDRISMLRTPGVVGIVSTGSHPVVIPDEEIAALRMATEQFAAEPHAYLTAGDRVRIVAGPLKGFEGILLRRKQGCRVVLSVEAILRSISVEMNESDLAAEWPLKRSA